MPYQKPLVQYFKETNGIQRVELTDDIINTALNSHLPEHSRPNPIDLILTELAAEGVDQVSTYDNIWSMFWKLDQKRKVLDPYKFRYTLGKAMLDWLSDYREFPKYGYSKYIRKGIVIIDHDNQRIDFIPNETFGRQFYDRSKYIGYTYKDIDHEKAIKDAVKEAIQIAKGPLP